jgi:hypothetical protein
VGKQTRSVRLSRSAGFERGVTLCVVQRRFHCGYWPQIESKLNETYGSGEHTGFAMSDSIEGPYTITGHLSWPFRLEIIMKTGISTGAYDSFLYHPLLSQGRTLSLDECPPPLSATLVLFLWSTLRPLRGLDADGNERAGVGWDYGV